MAPSLQTLFLPLETGDVPSDGDCLFLNAGWHPYLANLPAADLWQPFRPLAADLESHGRALLESPYGDKTYSLVLLHLPRQVEEAKYMLAIALEKMKPDGWLVAAAANDAGGGRIIGWLKELGLECESISKNKARAVYVQRPKSRPALLADWIDDGNPQWLDNGDGLQFMSQPGLFSWDEIDIASALLTQNFPATLTGTGADFGSGLGFLSYVLLQDFPAVNELHLLEADSRALACSKENLKDVQGDRTLHYHWADLTKPLPGLPPLDFIVMNPPFHAGKKTDAGIGQAFIKNAAHHLRKGGTLVMVANVHLPYEATLTEHFTKLVPLVSKDGFKILQATK